LIVIGCQILDFGRVFFFDHVAKKLCLKHKTKMVLVLV
jgi:hypothetical protein